MKRFISWFSPTLHRSLVYMLQSTEYDPKAYLKWFWRSRDLRNVATRKTLDRTAVARLLLGVIRATQLILWAISVVLIWIGFVEDSSHILLGVTIAVLTPVIVAHGVVVVIVLGRWLIMRPKVRRMSREAQHIFGEHPGTIIAIAGSYGKTTMKELLYTVLSKDLNVAASPANKNVAVAHAQLASSLSGHEDVVLVEYGEGRPGDVEAFARMTHPSMAVITGIAPVHLDQYKTLDAAAKDILSLRRFIDPDNLFLNGDSSYVKQYAAEAKEYFYTSRKVLGWRVANIKISITATSFELTKGTQKLKLTTGLIGEHQIGPVALAAALADRFDMSKKDIKEAVANTRPFPHRMQPYKLHEAWIIDDTYNGNIEGMRAGLKLLRELEASRKMYVTPGLVDQGNISEKVHNELGQAIAAANPDVVYLMKNSVTAFIKKGLQTESYQGECVIIEEPLAFYSNLDTYVAAGDIVLMQNDWTDNYH